MNKLLFFTISVCILLLSGCSGLEKFVATSQSNDSLTEIAMIKIGEDEQTEDILLIFAKRLEKLKQQYAENPAILEMLENSENVIIKQQASVSTMIIGANAKELEEELHDIIIKLDNMK